MNVRNEKSARLTMHLATGAMMAAITSAAIAAPTGSFTSPAPNFTLPPGATDTGAVSTQVLFPPTPESGSSVDVFFVTDTTGSMYGYINTVKSAFGSIASNLQSSRPDVYFRYGVADYKDFEDGGIYATSALRVSQNLTHDLTLVQNGLNTLGASGGGDGPEQNLASLQRIADNWISYGGDSTSQRIVVWAGDYEGWENGSKGYAYPKLQDTINALVAAGIQVFGLNTASAGDGIDGTGAGWGVTVDGRHQATAITTGTGGALFNGLASASMITSAIASAIETGLETVGVVSLTVDGDLGPWGLSINGTPVVGPFDFTDSPLLSDFGLSVMAPSIDDTRTVYLSLRADGELLTSMPLVLSTSVVPLPGAVWAGLALFGVIGIGRGVRLASRRRESLQSA